MRKDRVELLQGTLDMLILRTLEEGPLHGYDVVARIRSLSSDVLRVEEGSLYPALHRMEQRGWIEPEWGLSDNKRKAKYYHLTRSGRKQLQSERSNWALMSGAITGVMNGN